MTHQGPTSHPILITGEQTEAPVAVLTGIAVDLARRTRPVDSPVRVMVIDRADRSLIRLRQLPATDAYVAIDQPDDIEVLLGRIDADTSVEPRVPGLDVLVINEIGRLLSFLSRSGRADLAHRLNRIIGRHDGVRLMVAATCSEPDLLLPRVRSRFRSLLDCTVNGQGRLAGPEGERVIDLREWSPDRVTTAIASAV